jgi:hypothetical protein
VGLLLAVVGAPAPGDALVGDTLADRVLGQAGSFTTGNCNFSVVGAPPTAESLCMPSGLAFDAAGNLYVADLGNNRVLAFLDPLNTDAVADAVLGQGGSIESGACNLGGVSAASLCAPRAVTVGGDGNVYVADDFNHRVLGYQSPLTTDAVADVVLGQGDDFTSSVCDLGGISADSLCVVVGVAADSAGNLYVTDFESSRVLQYDDPMLTDTTADLVFGQDGSFASGVCALDGLSAASMCNPRAVAVDIQGNLYVADFTSSRTLEFDNPLLSDTVADRVFGAAGSFTSSFCNLGGVHAGSLCGPYSSSTAGTNDLYIVDRNNHRVLEYYEPLGSDDAADRVFGQADDFTSSGCNAGGITVASLCLPGAVLADANHNLWIADIGNSRVLGFDAPADRDGDGLADMDDGDDDADGIADDLEAACGSDPLDVTPPLSRPERVDGAFDGVDDDGDTQIDEALPVGAGASDCDGDGYGGSAENHVYSYLLQTNGNQKTCQEYDMSFINPNPDVRPSLRWPSDISKSTGPPNSFNRVNILDLTGMLAPVRYMATNVGSHPSDVRFDLAPGGPGTSINIADLAAMIAGSTGMPPMLGGVRAFGGPACPWAP